MRPILPLLIALLLALPASLAHVPPGPVLTCQNVWAGDGKYHDYLPPATGISVSPDDGNLEDCPKKSDLGAGGLGFCSETLAGSPIVCERFEVNGVPQLILDYDGELDHGYGGAVLFVHSGDGVTSGTIACYGWPSIGHHSSTIYVQDVVLGAVAFTIAADYNRPGVQATPECGDLLLEPCGTSPSTNLPFPVNAVVDTVTFLVFGPGGTGCNPLDTVQSCPVAAWPSGGPGPNRCNALFPPGMDGSYMVLVGRTAAPAPGGHVWTD